MRKKTIIAWSAIGAIVPIQSFAQGSDCKAECNKDASPYCLTIPTVIAGQDIPWAFRHLNIYLSKKFPELSIPQNMMLAFFGMTPAGDPCDRGTTTFKNGEVANSGKQACRIAVSVPLIVGVPDVKIGFDVPLELKATTSRSNDVFTFDFSTIAEANTADFWISNESLNGDWGGKLKWVQFAPRQVVVATENGCIKYSY